MRILLAGGGTGGHIFPLISVARALKKLAQSREIFDLNILCIGPDNKFKKYFFEEEINHLTVSSGKFRRYFSLRNILDIFKLAVGIFQSLWHVFWYMPDVIFSKGGYGGFPTLIGWFFKIPIIIHESDSVPGLANRILARFAKKIIISFPTDEEIFPEEKVILIGNPVREEILRGSKEEAGQIFNLTGERPIILVIGGSQGAKRINETVLETLASLIQKYEIIHQCGDDNYKDVETAAFAVLKEDLWKYYHLYPFLEERALANAYQAADLIISRAGAGSIFEIASIAKPSILIPLPNAAANHQFENAYIYASVGACEVLEESNLYPHFFTERIDQILENPEHLKQMIFAAQRFAKPDAAVRIAEEILKLGR